MAGIQLTLGVDVDASLAQFQTDIKALVAEIDKRGTKIKVGLDIDKQALKDLKDLHKQMSTLPSGGKNTAISPAVDTASAKKVTSAYNALAKAMERVTDAAKSIEKADGTWTRLNRLTTDGSGAMLSLGTGDVKSLQRTARAYRSLTKAMQTAEAAARGVKEAIPNVNEPAPQKQVDAKAIERGTKAYYKARIQAQNLLDNVSAGQKKWTKAHDGASAASYESLRTRAAELRKLLADLDGGQITSDTFDKRLSDIKTKFLDASRTIREAGENMSFGKQLVSDTKEYSSLLTQINTLLKQVQSNQTKWTKARHGATHNQYKTLSGSEIRLQALRESVSNGTITDAEAAKQFATIREQVTSANAAIMKAGEATRSWGDRVGALSAKFSTWLSISQVVMQVYRGMRAVVTNVIELDTAMTELRKVTDESEASLTRFMGRAAENAKKYGSAMTDAVYATAEFARLGFNLNDSEQLANAAMVYKNVGDGIEDITAASESIIATMQAFGIEAKDAMSIVDRFNEVGNKYAISSKGVGDAMLRSAAALHSANNTIDESIALIAAANTIVQDPDKVGTTLRTVSMYLRAAKTEADSAGESTDGMAASVSELRSEILALTGQKVDIQLDDHTFKSTYQILKELSGVWDELTDVSQANILELIGGKRNANVVAALLENFDVAGRAAGTSADSAGSALKENEKVLDSIQGHFNKLKASAEEFSSTFLESDLVKTLVDIADTITNIGTGLARAHNLLPEFVAAAAATAKNVGGDKMFSPLIRRQHKCFCYGKNNSVWFVPSVRYIEVNQMRAA